MLVPKRKYGARVHETVIAGMRALVLENKSLRVTVLLDKGSDIIEFLHKPTDTDWLGFSPMGLRNPQMQVVTTSGTNGNMIDSYEGCWQEIFPNGGDACCVDGIEYGQHGEASLLIWDYTVEKDSPEKIIIRLSTQMIRSPFQIMKWLELEAEIATLSIRETIINKGAQELPAMWGQHPAFGAPALDEKCIVNLSNCKVHTREDILRSTAKTLVNGSEWPMTLDGTDLSRVMPAKAGVERMYFLTDLTEGKYEIVNNKKRIGFRLEWPLNIYPYLWYWHNSGIEGSPWFGQAYLLALEPFTSPVPQLVEALKRGWARVLKPDESLSVWLRATALGSFDIKA